MNHKFMMQLTEKLPMKTIQIGNKDYLQRYYNGTDVIGRQHIFHRFLAADSERHHHSHPWSAQSFILCGSYVEHSLIGCVTMINEYKAGDCNKITPDAIHRIVSVEPNTWTRLVINPERLPEWFFIDDEGNKQFIKTSHTDWHLSCNPRQ